MKTEYEKSRDYQNRKKLVVMFLYDQLKQQQNIPKMLKLCKASFKIPDVDIT